MPTVILEAMARGCAIIASDVGAVQKQVSSKNGFLVQAGNTGILYNTIKEAIYLSDRDLHSKKENSIQIVKQKYLWEDLSFKMMEGFKSIAKTGKCEEII
jgi:glycosyltransferase involved in cell wall biosynthesis